MRDLPGVSAQADPTVECRRSQPNWPTFDAAFKHSPKAHMMTTVSARTFGLLKREVFLTAVIEKVAYWRIPIRSVEQHAANDFDARAQGDCVSRKPVRTCIA